jgi:hypothetical protein
MLTPMIDDKETVRKERIYFTPVEKEPIRLVNGFSDILQRDVILSVGPRVRWESIVGGCVVALGSF